MRIANLFAVALGAQALAGPAAAATPPLDNFRLNPGPAVAPIGQGPVEEGAPPPSATVAPSPAPTADAVRSPAAGATPGAARDTNAPPARPLASTPTTRPPSEENAPPAARRPAAASPAPATSRPSSPQPAADRSSTPPAPTPTPTPEATEASQPAVSTVPAPPPSVASSSAPAVAGTAVPFAPAPEAEQGELGRWPLAAAGALLALLLAGAAGFVLRRRRASGPLSAPELEDAAAAERALQAKPKPKPKPEQKPRAEQMALPLAPTAEEVEGISVALEARQFSFTLTSAALAYRITLTNNSKARIKGLTVTGDLTSAHASEPSDAQLAGPAGGLAPCHEIESLAAGATTQVTGEFRLPYSLIKPIRKDAAILFVPLARLRVEAASSGRGAALLTALIGQRSRTPGGGLQPFRLDLGPRIYREVTQRIFS